MSRILFILCIFSVSINVASASEYCYDRHKEDIRKANEELNILLERQIVIDKDLANIYKKTSDIISQLSQATTKEPLDIVLLQRLGEESEPIERQKVSLEGEGFKIQDRIVSLKKDVPQVLQGQLRGCVEATAPTNRVVNLTIQSLAILSTGGLSVTLPPKSLYVDMSSVLNGYPTGGSKSIVNEAREAVLNALGMGGENNDLGNFVRDPFEIFGL